jgi:hypothetical protein
MRGDFVTALGLAFLAFTLFIFQSAPAAAQGCNLGSRDCVCPGYGKCFYKAGSRNWCEQKGAPYLWDPATGSCVKHISKTKPVTSGGAGGGGSAQDDCEAKGANYRYDPQTGVCMKTISKTKPPPVVIPGGDAEAARASPEQEACENRGGNWHWHPETGSCVKHISKAQPGPRHTPTGGGGW